MSTGLQLAFSPAGSHRGSYFSMAGFLISEIAFGGDSSAVQLRNVQHLKAGYHAFVASERQIPVVTWGEASQVQEQFPSL